MPNQSLHAARHTSRGRCTHRCRCLGLARLLLLPRCLLRRQVREPLFLHAGAYDGRYQGVESGRRRYLAAAWSGPLFRKACGRRNSRALTYRATCAGAHAGASARLAIQPTQLQLPGRRSLLPTCVLFSRLTISLSRRCTCVRFTSLSSWKPTCADAGTCRVHTGSAQQFTQGLLSSSGAPAAWLPQFQPPFLCRERACITPAPHDHAGRRVERPLQPAASAHHPKFQHATVPWNASGPPPCRPACGAPAPASSIST